MATTITANGINFPDGSASSPSIGGSDTNTGLFTGADIIGFSTGGSERLRIDSSGRVHIGNSGLSATASADDLTVGNLSGDHGITVFSATDSAGFIIFGDTDSTGVGSRDGVIRYQQSDSSMRFATNGNNERMRIDSSGRLLLGTTTEGEGGADDLTISNTSADMGITLRSGTANNGQIFFSDGTSGNAEFAGFIQYAHNGNSMRFGVNESERMRILSNGDFEFNGVGTATPGNANNTTGMGFEPRNGSIFLSRSDAACFRTNINTTDTDIVQFSREGTLRGRVFMQTTSVSYATTSDYRLKENQVLISDGITRLKTLKPYRFNFIEEPSKTVDGFFAHEVTAVPEAVSGTKDAVDSDGNIEPQGLDYGRITPLLTAALQEAVARIEALETKVAALEAG
nr:endosialidase [uncultured Mediterranean phage uvMED]